MKVGSRITCEEVGAFYSSRDMAISEPISAAREATSRAGTFDDLLAAHEESWSRIWARAALEIHEASGSAQRLVNLHLFHVLQVASINVIDHDVGLGARGLHGEGYLGHVFWDELFVLPTLALRFPAIARSLLAYRSRRLGSARSAAPVEGHVGAMFPWQSGSDGRDETPVEPYNERSKRWIADSSHFQRHVWVSLSLTTSGSIFKQPATSKASLRHWSGGHLRGRALLCQPHPLRRKAWSIPDRGGDGSRRVSQRLSVARRARRGRQRLHQRHDSVVARAGGRSRSPRTRARSGRRARALGSWQRRTGAILRGCLRATSTSRSTRQRSCPV